MDIHPLPLLFLGISGCPSSGKSTLAYLLTLIYPDSILLHADDFSKDEGVPLLPPPLNCLDSDSVYGVDFNAMYKVLDHIKATGQLHDGYESWFQNNIMTIEEGQNRVRDTDAIDVEDVRKTLEGLLQDTGNASSTSTEQKKLPRLVILEGFLLYHDPEIRKRLDLMLFLRLSKATAKARRLAKPGWGKDAKPNMYWATEPYFEASVWKNYVQEHAWLFINGDVQGDLLQDVAARERIEATPVLDWSLQETAVWAVGLLGRAMPGQTLAK
jgi:nicotinamide/nicotinate riboside kinase